MSYTFKIIVLIGIGISLFIGSIMLLHGDILYNSDVARDFLLLEEVQQKKIVLIGPRADWQGLFHGPLWLYLNLPGYVIGNGNPAVMGWYWVFLTVCFLFIGFFVAKKLFGESVAYLYSLLLSVAMIFHMNGYINSYGALFLFPLFFYSIARYVHSQNIRYLVITLFIQGLIIQFQMAVGMPLLLLTILLFIFLSQRYKLWRQSPAFLVLLIPLSTFILFDIRHNFEQFHSILRFFSNHSHPVNNPFSYVLENRITFMTYLALDFFKGAMRPLNIFISYLFVLFLVGRIQDRKKDTKSMFYILFLYYYVGFFIISLIQDKGLLKYYIDPWIGVILLIFSSMILYYPRKIFIGLFCILLIQNISVAINVNTRNLQQSGKIQTSWVFQKNLAAKVFQQSPDDFGYFIYTPDQYAYGPKYAMLYLQKQYPNKLVTPFQKRPTTYLLFEPPPADKPYLTGVYWKKSQVNIQSEPVDTYEFPNHFRIETYHLDKKDIDSRVDPNIDTFAHFR